MGVGHPVYFLEVTSRQRALDSFATDISRRKALSFQIWVKPDRICEIESFFAMSEMNPQIFFNTDSPSPISSRYKPCYPCHQESPKKTAVVNTKGGKQCTTMQSQHVSQVPKSVYVSNWAAHKKLQNML